MARSQHEVAQPLLSTQSPIVCRPQDSVTWATVAINTDLGRLDPLERVKLVEDLSNHLSLSRDHVSLRAEAKGDMLDSSEALVSGLGDQKRKPAQLGAMLYWVVGCGAVKSHQMEILERLESMAKNGRLSRSIGYGVGAWQVTITKPQSLGKRRLKRQAGVTATPAPGKNVWVDGNVLHLK